MVEGDTNVGDAVAAVAKHLWTKLLAWVGSDHGLTRSTGDVAHRSIPDVDNLWRLGHVDREVDELAVSVVHISKLGEGFAINAAKRFGRVGTLQPIGYLRSRD